MIIINYSYDVIIIFNGDILIYVRLDLKNKVVILYIEIFFFLL